MNQQSVTVSPVPGLSVRAVLADISDHGACMSGLKSFGLRLSLSGWCGFAVLLLAGCGTSLKAPAPSSGIDAALSGQVFGGQQPVSHATIQVYAAGSNGDGSAATALFQTPTTTNQNGQFDLGAYTCPTPDTPVYLVATGGDPGLGAQNPALTMMEAIGPCSSLATAPSFLVNEVTTVAGVWALAPYMRSFSEVGSGTSDAAQLASAFALAHTLADPASGVPAGYTVPTSTINTVADILSSCVNSAGGVAGDLSACGLLFSYAAAAGGSTPANTLDAALAIAQHPSSEVANIFGMLPSHVPYQPALPSAPPSWSIGLVPAAPATGLPLVMAKSAAAFVDSVGIDVHFNYYGSIYTNDTPLMISSLQALHIRHLRDAMCWQGPQSWNTFYALHQQLGGLGFKTDYVPSVTQPIAQVAAYPALVTDMEAVEPANEYDISGDAQWPAAIKAQQAAIYAAFHGSHPEITVLAPSLAYPSNAAGLGNVSAIADAGNLHGYFGGYNPGSVTINPAIYLSQVRPESLSEPVWVTETGYFAQPGPFNGTYGVSPAIQAAYSTRALLEWANAGVARTYLYELADDEIPTEDPANYHWGLLNSDGTPKPAFHAVANLLSMLSDPQAAGNFQPAPLAFALQGADSSVHQALFQKSDGSYYLALWVEAQSYDFLGQQPLPVPTQNVSVHFASVVGSASTTQWDDTGNATTTSLTAAQTLNLTVSDRLQILKITLP